MELPVEIDTASCASWTRMPNPRSQGLGPARASGWTALARHRLAHKAADSAGRSGECPATRTLIRVAPLIRVSAHPGRRTRDQRAGIAGCPRPDTVTRTVHLASIRLEEQGAHRRVVRPRRGSMRVRV